MQESDIKTKLKELQLKFGKVSVATRSMQALVDGENYSGVSQTLPVLLQELADFETELNALATAPEKKISPPNTKKVKKEEPVESPIEEEDGEPEE